MRLLDTVASFVGLVILSPLLLLVALLIKVDSPGPIFYRAERVGKDGRLFRIFKFRTMVADAALQGPGVTSAGDNRITTIGEWLRETKIDELPQLINVLKGEMGLVGPRPEDPRYVALYTPEQLHILTVRPGITSAASLTYCHEEQMLAGPDWETIYRTEVMPAKLEIDLAYISNRTPVTDLALILKTIRSMLFTQSKI